MASFSRVRAAGDAERQDGSAEQTAAALGIPVVGDGDAVNVHGGAVDLRSA
jgi:hypothetical protein